jgi:hypothetical protein
LYHHNTTSVCQRYKDPSQLLKLLPKLPQITTKLHPQLQLETITSTLNFQCMRPRLDGACCMPKCAFSGIANSIRPWVCTGACVTRVPLCPARCPDNDSRQPRRQSQGQNSTRVPCRAHTARSQTLYSLILPLIGDNAGASSRGVTLCHVTPGWVKANYTLVLP